jgi:hypothetical protein
MKEERNDISTGCMRDINLRIFNTEHGIVHLAEELQ